MMKTRKTFLTVALAAMAIGTAIPLAACGGGESGMHAGGLGGGPGTEAEAGVSSAYGIGAVTTTGLLASVSPSGAASLAASDAGGAGSTGEARREETENFNAYFNMLDTFLDEGAFRSTAEENRDPSYPYDYKLTVEGADLSGGTVTHVMYYSETLAAARDEDDGRGETQSSVAYTLTGIMESGGVTYEMNGYRMSETETERDETETSEELWIRASDPARPGTYVRMDLETENEEERGESEISREYTYSVYADGKLVERTSVDFEVENERGETETEYELVILKDGVRNTYEIERAGYVNGTVSVGVRYSGPDGSGRFVVTQTKDGTYVYTFEDDSRLEFDDFDD